MYDKGTLLLKRSDIESLMTWEDYINGMETAFGMIAEGRSFGSGMLHADAEESEFHIKSGGLHLSRPYLAIKSNGSCYTNMSRFGLPNMMGTIMLFDAENAFPLAILDSIDITRKRTGATTAVAATYLARQNSKTVLICGCGNQGRIQLTALKEVISPETVYAWSRNPETGEDFVEEMETFAEEMSSALSLDVRPAPDLKSVARGSDIIVTCTPSRKTYLYADWIRPGTFISAIGADSPDKQENDPQLLAKGKVIVDLPEQCARVGELHHALEAGLMTVDDIAGTLGEVITGQVKGRISDEETIIFDATGTAIQDAAGAALCYEKAAEKGVGQFVDLNS